jgi:nicotinate-nucleotide pyrophosphorylase (carboxylating)
MSLDFKHIKTLIDIALAEDIGKGDLTTIHTIPARRPGSAVFRTRESGVLAGAPLIEYVYKRLDRNIRVKLLKKDGARLRAGQKIAGVSGKLRAILTGERLVLNLLSHLSGIASLTREYVDAAENRKVEVRDTRKTTPGYRYLEKYAVRCGGGHNHRMGLYDQVMVKDNHLAVAGEAGFPVEEIIAGMRKSLPKKVLIEVEADRVSQVKRFLAMDVDIIMLDNMSLAQMRRCVELASDRRVILEASGNVTLRRIGAIAKTGVDWISVGRITHSAPALDIGLDIDPS